MVSVVLLQMVNDLHYLQSVISTFLKQGLSRSWLLHHWPASQSFCLMFWQRNFESLQQTTYGEVFKHRIPEDQWTCNVLFDIIWKLCWWTYFKFVNGSVKCSSQFVKHSSCVPSLHYHHSLVRVAWNCQGQRLNTGGTVAQNSLGQNK